MAGQSIRDAYVEMLLERVREENYPNPDHLDRIEACVRSPEQVLEYISILLSKIEGTRYPSGAILDRVQRFAMIT
jgi:hypothetical protein